MIFETILPTVKIKADLTIDFSCIQSLLHLIMKPIIEIYEKSLPIIGIILKIVILITITLKLKGNCCIVFEDVTTIHAILFSS
jgi:hypothetical protein